MSKKADYGRGGINDCPKCHLHYVNPRPIVIDGDKMWEVFCTHCGYSGPVAYSPRFAIRYWNMHEYTGEDYWDKADDVRE